MTRRVLVVDDDQHDNDRYCQLLRSCGFEVVSASSADQAFQIIRQQTFDAVLLDMLLTVFLKEQGRLDFGGITVLKAIKASDSATQVIAVTGYGSRDLAVEATREGAMDFITKDFDTEDRLPKVLHIAVTKAQALRAIAAARQVDTDLSSFMPIALPEQIVANSAAMREMLRRAYALAGIASPLLITGEAGVGKTLVASIIHLNGNQASGPFVVVQCRSLSRDLSELFGEAGRPDSGLCAKAEGGTLVLKGIHELPFNQQKRLVDLVTNQLYTPIGGESVSCHLRIIASTTMDLPRLVQTGRFWRDLYAPLSIATLKVPPLRERRDTEDIGAIAGYLLHRYGLAHGISPAATAVLSLYDYAQGNINELDKILREAASAASGTIIELHHLPQELQALANTAGGLERDDGTAKAISMMVRFVPSNPPRLIWDSHVGGGVSSTFHAPFQDADLQLVLRALDAHQWAGSDLDRPKFSDDERSRLRDLNLWAGNWVASDIDQRVGQVLYRALVSDPTARSILESARNLAAGQSQQLALTLRFEPESIQLAALPWELLWDTHQPLLLSKTRLASCVRYIDVPHFVPPPLGPRRTLRLLAVCPTTGVSEELHRAEAQGRAQALQPLVADNLLTIEELRPAFISSLTDRLEDGPPVDILHFYGHGGWQNGAAFLQFDDGRLSSNQVAALVSDVPLIVLHACRSGNVGEESMFTGIAPLLSIEGVAAVVAMQFSVEVKAANRFSAVLYRHLARGVSLQTAVAKARHILYIEHKSSWYVPVVYLRSRDLGPFRLLPQTRTG